MEEKNNAFTLVEAIDLMTKNIAILDTLSNTTTDQGTAFILDQSVTEIRQAAAYIYGYLSFVRECVSEVER